MSEQEKERHRPMSDDPEVAAHRTRPYDEGSEDSDAELERKRKASDEDPDVEAHRNRA